MTVNTAAFDGVDIALSADADKGTFNWEFRGVPVALTVDFFTFLAREDGLQILSNIAANWLYAAGGLSWEEYRAVVREVPHQ
ncbi:hypothetical protein SEA_NANOSMITE_86 [Mycobacterium phage Nanosmite]|nr:hypothetical protein SEA_NANOSMITE_86 [Mycobacterium phage Nanosmite]